ncbi:hypothetical protein CVT25_012806 [Psilocybe cyanescens]|uniref:Uncharacterized protein n=1 Tax=Psilocybe cyanescens TaxID=93625 RepID=A0A409XLE9_PSICY|nr:hypothetical protein CVT25_012806 [Psilocybe cyanescens]
MSIQLVTHLQLTRIQAEAIRPREVGSAPETNLAEILLPAFLPNDGTTYRHKIRTPPKNAHLPSRRGSVDIDLHQTLMAQA